MKDRTAQAVSAQLDAMGCDTFEVGVFNSQKEMMITKVWDKETVLKSIQYLKYQNMQGNHIYVRPSGEHGLTLIDDIKTTSIEQMKKEGFAPAAVVETSPNNFQAWLKHDKVLPTDVSTRASKELATQYEGDQGSADWRHYGRLAGFTNCKPKYKQPNGLYPFVLLREAGGQTYEKVNEFLDGVEKKHASEKKKEQERRAQFANQSPSLNKRITKTINDFRNDPRYSGDYHRAELGYAVYAMSRGAADNEIVSAIMTRDLSHKGSNDRQVEYAERTVKKAAEIAKNQQEA